MNKKTPELINNRYEIKRQIGEGGMGKTFLAFDRKSKTDVVVKILHLARAREWKVVELFEREAAALKNIDHPFIPNYIDYFTEDRHGDTAYCLVQEYIPGKNLKQLVEEGKRFKEADVLRIAEKLLSILAYLQQLRPPVIHRDINPKNIIISDNNEVYLVDFGAVQGVVKNALAGGSTVVGTYGYMPMEQLMGKACPASDLYAVGVTLLYLLSHKNPEDFPIKDMRLDYKEEVKIAPRYLVFLDRLMEPDQNKRLPDAAHALDLLARLKEGKAPVSKQSKVLLDLDSLTPPFQSRIRSIRKDTDLLITIPGKILLNLPLAGFLVFWFGFVSFWTMIALKIGGPFALFSMPFWIAGVLMLGKVINDFTRASVNLSPESVTIKRGFLGKKKLLPQDQITRIEYHEIQRVFRYQGPGAQAANVPARVAYGVKIEAGAVSVTLDKSLTESEAAWLAKVIQTYGSCTGNGSRGL